MGEVMMTVRTEQQMLNVLKGTVVTLARLTEDWKMIYLQWCKALGAATLFCAISQRGREDSEKIFSLCEEWFLNALHPQYRRIMETRKQAVKRGTASAFEMLAEQMERMN